MKKTHKTKPKTSKQASTKLLVVIGVAFVLAVIALFIFRGWVRMTALPKSIQTIYGNTAEKVYGVEMDKLQDPLNSFGYSSTPISKTGCHTILANKLKTQIDCSYHISADRKVDVSPQGQKNINTNAQKLQALLYANGWQGEYSNDEQPYTSLVKLVSSVSSGIDYQPDATYEKHVDGVVCYLHSNTAFSHPEPAALSMQISCSRTFNILGEPNWD